MDYDFPKVELHCHLDGAVCPQTQMRLAAEQGIGLPTNDPDEFLRYATYSPDCRTVNEYLEKFALPLRVMQDFESISTITAELVSTLAAQGVRLAEIRFAPQLHCERGLCQQDAVDAVICGAAAGMRDNPTLKVGVLLCMMALGPDPTQNFAANRETAALAYKNLGSVVRGLDLAGAEGLAPLSAYAELFREPFKQGVPLTCHAGDSVGADTVRDALSFGVSRIGHGHHIADDMQLCELAIEKGITFEMCLSSNIQCHTQPSFEQHPIKKLYDMGMHTTLNTDNMVIAGVTLDSEYDIALSRCGFTRADLIKMNIYSLQGAFTDSIYRQQLIDELQAYLQNR